jgi:hypothetical protein
MMLMRRAAIKRAIAALLPVSLLWVFVACVSICARESADTYNPLIASASIEVNDAPDGEGCPLASFPKATAPARGTLIFNVEPSNIIPVSIPSVNSLENKIVGRVATQQSFTSPPLELLPTLRV